MFSMLREISLLLRVRKKFWLGPIIVVLMLFGVLLVFAQSSAVRRSSIRSFSLRLAAMGINDQTTDCDSVKPALAGERHEPLERAVGTAQAREAMHQWATGEEVSELLLHERRQG